MKLSSANFLNYMWKVRYKTDNSNNSKSSLKKEENGISEKVINLRLSPQMMMMINFTEYHHKKNSTNKIVNNMRKSYGETCYTSLNKMNNNHDNIHDIHF